MLWVLTSGTALVAYLLRRRAPHWIIYLYLATWIFFPASAFAYYVPSPPLFHLLPQTWLVIFAVIFALIFSGREFQKFLSTYPMGFFLTAVVMFMTLVTLVGESRLDLVFNQILGPLLALAFTLYSQVCHNQSKQKIRSCLILLSSVQAVAVLAEFSLQKYIFFVNANKEYFIWYNSSEFDRPFGTTSHALVAGLLLASAIPLLASYKSVLARISISGLLLGGVLATQTRVSLVVAVVGLMYLVFVAKSSFVARFFLTLTMAGAGLLIFANSSKIPVFERLILNDRSTQLRAQAYDWFLNNWPDYSFIGKGMGSSYDVALEAGLESSFESSVIQLVIDFGVPLTLLFVIGIFLFLKKTESRPYRLRGSLVSFIAAAMCTTTFSSLNAQTLIGPVLFVLMALAVTQEQDHSSTAPPSVVEGIRSSTKVVV